MSFPNLSRVIHPSFTGFTAGTLPRRYVVSFEGGVQVPASHLTRGTAQSHWYYDSAINAVERLKNGIAHDSTLSTGNLSCGLWLNDGTYYFDVSTSFHGLDIALDFARMNNQLAIYDTVTKETITV